MERTPDWRRTWLDWRNCILDGLEEPEKKGVEVGRREGERKEGVGIMVGGGNRTEVQWSSASTDCLNIPTKDTMSQGS